MKKLILGIALFSFVGGTSLSAASLGDDKKKEKSKKECCKKGETAKSSCCKKGEGKTCSKEKAETPK